MESKKNNLFSIAKQLDQAALAHGVIIEWDEPKDNPRSDYDNEVGFIKLGGEVVAKVVMPVDKPTFLLIPYGADDWDLLYPDEANSRGDELTLNSTSSGKDDFNLAIELVLKEVNEGSPLINYEDDKTADLFS
jgi:hypothetical protein